MNTSKSSLSLKTKEPPASSPSQIDDTHKLIKVNSTVIRKCRKVLENNNDDNFSKKSSSKLISKSFKSMPISLAPSTPTISLAKNNNNYYSSKSNIDTANLTSQRQMTFHSPRPPSIINPHPLQRSKSSRIEKSTTGSSQSRQSLRRKVENAIQEGKIFSCTGGYQGIRNGLKKRGWIEKLMGLGVDRNFGFSVNDSHSLRSLQRRQQPEIEWMNRRLKDHPPDFIWLLRRGNIDWHQLNKGQIVNRFPNDYFTTKVGIATCLQNIQWYSEAGISETFFPRCYRLGVEEEKSSFIFDYQFTACMGLLKWVVGAFETDGEIGLIDPNPLKENKEDEGILFNNLDKAIQFSLHKINNYVRQRKHEDLDTGPAPWDSSHQDGLKWSTFLDIYYSAVCLKKKCFFGENSRQDSGRVVEGWYNSAKKGLQKVAPFWPQLGIDGTNNIWICKPGAKSMGQGIVLLNRLDKILHSQSASPMVDCVAQKYIERPMLIYQTKFDIRQWFIVSDWSPLTVWFYKESYLRFCAQPFSLNDFHEKIHLCNNAVQCRYQNAVGRDRALPKDNMWDNYTFQAYLKSIDRLDLWQSKIYPGMKQGILGIMQASQESMKDRKNSFELYGADFLISEDGRPWLIEINSCPCMASTTHVTSRMCRQCLEDCVKVIIDHPKNKNADTGMFELIYKQNPDKTSHRGETSYESDFVVTGTKMKRETNWLGKTMSTVRFTTVNDQHPLKPMIMDGCGNSMLDLVHRLNEEESSKNCLLTPSPAVTSSLRHGDDDYAWCQGAVHQKTEDKPVVVDGKKSGKKLKSLITKVVTGESTSGRQSLKAIIGQKKPSKMGD